MSQLYPKITVIPLNALGGGFTPIILTIMASRFEVIEDPSVNNGVQQGLTGYYTDTQPGSGFPEVGTQRTWLPNNNGQIGVAFEPIISESRRVHGGEGDYVGAQGTIVLQLQSLTQNTTQVLLAEWP